MLVTGTVMLSKPAVAACNPGDPGYPNCQQAEEIEEEADEKLDHNQACWEKTGFASFFICPGINIIHSIFEAAYNIIIDKFSQINPRFLAFNSPTFDAWSKFRDIGNIFFVIIFLIVIISQLTGVMIDNYGIKKILPRLIVTALLINLSYFIAQLAVDASNLIGAGVMKFLTTLAERTASEYGVEAVGVMAVETTLIAIIFFNPGIVLTAVPIMIACLGGVFTLFVMLVIRQAGVVILVVISPIAFACYLLPNTQVLFKKFMNIAKAMLVFYPLAGLMMGAGDIVSVVLLKIAGEEPGPQVIFFTLAGLAAPCLPLFALPTLLRKSMDGLGNIGTRLSGWGNGLSRAGANRVANSQWFRRAKNNLDRWGVTNADGTLNRRGQLRRRLGGGAGIANTLAEEAKLAEERAQTDLMLDPNVRAKKLREIEVQAEAQKYDAQQKMNSSSKYYDAQLEQAHFKTDTDVKIANAQMATPGYWQTKSREADTNIQLDTMKVEHMRDNNYVLDNKPLDLRMKLDSELADNNETRMLEGTFDQDVIIKGKLQNIKIDNVNNRASMQTALEQAIQGNNRSTVMALTKIMGEKGYSNEIINGYTNGMNGLSGKAATDMRRAVASRLNTQQIKEENRDLFEWQKENSGPIAALDGNGKPKTMQDYALSAMSKMTASAMGKLDADALARHIDAMNSKIIHTRIQGGSLSADDADMFNNMIDAAQSYQGDSDSAKKLRAGTKLGTLNRIDQIAKMNKQPPIKNSRIILSR